MADKRLGHELVSMHTIAQRQGRSGGQAKLGMQHAPVSHTLLRLKFFVHMAEYVFVNDVIT